MRDITVMCQSVDSGGCLHVSRSLTVGDVYMCLDVNNGGVYLCPGADSRGGGGFTCVHVLTVGDVYMCPGIDSGGVTCVQVLTVGGGGGYLCPCVDSGGCLHVSR